MKRTFGRVCAVLFAVMFLSITVMELNAHARAGGSRSSGSRGSRSYTSPASPSSQPSQPRQRVAPAPNTMQQQPASGGFMRSMAGGLMGGMLGSMLFSSFAGAGAHGMGGGGGIGLFEIALLAGIGYLIYRYMKKKKAESELVPAYSRSSQHDTMIASPASPQDFEPAFDQVATGITHIQQMDHNFDEARFNDTVMDIFFKIQAAWMNRNLSTASGLLTDGMRQILQADIDQLLRDKQINRLENVAVRKVELAEVWQESGQDYITTLILANLLDYTTDETSGAVISGSTSEPVKFEEYWTFTRAVGNNPWQLSAIHQK